MTDPQFVVCTFRKGDTRSYTYHNDGDPVAAGDEVKVEDPRSTEGGWKRVYVVSVGGKKPPFPTKPILGLAPPKADPVPEIQEDLIDGLDVGDGLPYKPELGQR